MLRVSAAGTGSRAEAIRMEVSWAEASREKGRIYGSRASVGLMPVFAP